MKDWAERQLQRTLNQARATEPGTSKISRPTAPAGAAHAFARTRTLALDEAPDPLVLAVASYGEEARLHLNRAQGLTEDEDSAERFFLDHDQRHTLTLGSFLSLPSNSYIFGEFHYGSGFPNLGDEDHSATHLPGHARFDLGGGKSFGKKWQVTINVLNVTNGSYLLDNSPLLGGVHWVEPRQIWAEVRYKFHY